MRTLYLLRHPKPMYKKHGHKGRHAFELQVEDAPRLPGKE